MFLDGNITTMRFSTDTAIYLADEFNANNKKTCIYTVVPDPINEGCSYLEIHDAPITPVQELSQ